jgi:K+-transporting ATPase ATPase C chain
MWRLAAQLIARSARAVGVFTLLTGLVYPLVVTGFAQALFSDRASGALVSQGGRAVGSTLIGQPTTRPDVFWGRPSMTADPATGDPSPYHAMASAASNLGPSSAELSDQLRARVTALRAGGADPQTPVPVDLATSSGSGLDPDLSPAAALYQVPRIAKSRGVDEAALRRLIDAHTRSPLLGLFGAPRVNVLELNLALGAMDSGRAAADPDSPEARGEAQHTR